MNDRFALQPLEQRRLMASGTILFVRGADRSGGFLEATNDAQRTEQLADINNTSTAAGNHGWGQLAALLRGQGYTVTQVVEPLERGAPSTGQTTGRALDLANLNLSQYTAVVMASNNARYDRTQVDALDAYVRGGGAVLFISDGNFGSDWADAPTSDNAFLERYGLAFNQDNGTYPVRTARIPDEPVLFGVYSLGGFDGEGVSPIRISATAGKNVLNVTGAHGTTFDNNPTSTANNSRGMERTVDGRDASLVLVPGVGRGRVGAFFDRNTFFNANGAGTDLTRNKNQRLASNLFEWLTDTTPPAVTSSDFAASTRVLRFSMDDNLRGSPTRDTLRLRNRRTGENLSGKLWTLAVGEGVGLTDVVIRIDKHAPAGAYQLRVPRATVADDSGNVRSGAIRYAFTIPSAAASRAPAAAASLRGIAAFARPTALFARPVDADSDDADEDVL